MTQMQNTRERPESPTISDSDLAISDLAISNLELGRKLKFGRDDGFQRELRRRVDAYFQGTQQSQRDCSQMYLKTAIILVAFATTYLSLVFLAQTWWQALPLAILLGLETAAIGFNIQHDGGHQGYSNRRWLNQAMALTLDMVGGSSYVWHWKHAVFHHMYTNIHHYDADLNVGILGRVSPHHPWLPIHRWQHIYLWALYGLMPIKWQLYDDFQDVISGRIGEQTFPRPQGWDLVRFLLGKACFLTLAFGLPLMRHPLGDVVIFYGVAAIALGIVLSIVFQMAHCVEGVGFPLPMPTTGNMEEAWAIHQIETTVNFSRHNPVITWLLGGLNFQVEHHLFPRICHIHYPALANVVESTCREFGVTYREHPSFIGGVVSHARWLQRLGASSTMG
jgi:linoleoyl-CoA desaturase